MKTASGRRAANDLETSERPSCFENVRSLSRQGGRLSSGGTINAGAHEHRNHQASAKTTFARLRGVVGRLLAPTLMLAVALLLAHSSAIAQSAPLPESVVGSSGHLSETGYLQRTSGPSGPAPLEVELNGLLRQQTGDPLEADSKLLSEAIISRLMLGNLSDSSSSSNEPESDSDQATEQQQQQAELSGPEAARLHRFLSYLLNYESQAPGNYLYPVLPASQAATIKRASLKLSSYLRGQQQQQQQQRQLNGYGRNSFDFGLGKRPDASVASNILRFGDSLGHLQTVAGQLGKRPSAHRYDFGLGKRVASPVYPRYDFGLGKRAPNRLRYDFGLGK